MDSPGPGMFDTPSIVPMAHCLPCLRWKFVCASFGKTGMHSHFAGRFDSECSEHP